MSLKELIGKEIVLKVDDLGNIKTFFGRIIEISDDFVKFEYKNGRIRHFNVKYIRDACESEFDDRREDSKGH